MNALHALRPLALVLSLAPFMSTPLPAHEVDASGTAQGLVIHDAASTLREYCAPDSEGRLWITLPGGWRFELITSTDDPGIINPGDGAFHPFDAAEVTAALAQLSFPVAGISAEVFLLPYPRRAQIESAAGPRLILMSPGVRPLTREHQHAEFVHELGHVVHHALMPDGDGRWDTYRRLREIDDARYSPTAPHADRPHEIFAEDFRALFGGPRATYSGTIENSSLASPEDVPGLSSFMLGLAGVTAPLPILASPNPTRGALRFTLAGASEVPLDLFDAGGRRIASLAPRATAGAIEWNFDGFDAAGRPVAPGVLFARPRGARHSAARIIVVP